MRIPAPIREFHTDNGPRCSSRPDGCPSTIYTYRVSADWNEVDSYCHGCHRKIRPAFLLSTKHPQPNDARDFSRIHRAIADRYTMDDGRRDYETLVDVPAPPQSAMAPGETRYTDREAAIVRVLIADAADASERLTDDELERHAAQLRKDGAR